LIPDELWDVALDIPAQVVDELMVGIVGDDDGLGA